MKESLRDSLMNKLKVLNETVWSGAQLGENQIDAWLENFCGAVTSVPLRS